MNVKLIAHTPDPEKVVASAANLCYSGSDIDSLFNGMTSGKAGKMIKMLESMGHESPFEHVSFTFAIEGVSRSLLAQITRHRLASFSVQSQRYVRNDNLTVVEPEAIENNPKCQKIFEETMDAMYSAYTRITAILKEQYIAEGMNETDSEKKAIEDARFVLPNAATTKMIVTMNARELLHFFSMRTCNRAQWEIRELAECMMTLAYKAAPNLFSNAGPSCVKGKCTEGVKSCGKCAEVREHIAEVKANE